MKLKIKHSINLHKGTTGLLVVGLMVGYHNFSIGPWVYLAIHGTYGLLWLLKDRIYPDKQWEKEIPIGLGVGTFILLGLYWVAPWLLISRGFVPSAPLISGAIALNIIGIFLHYVSDAQKYFTLKYQPGLMTEGFFARCRNTNYLGEILIYGSFALLAWHWLPVLILGGFVAGIFVPNMLKKDKSLSRYPGFDTYKAQSGLLIPSILSLPKTSQTTTNESGG